MTKKKDIKLSLVDNKEYKARDYSESIGRGNDYVNFGKDNKYPNYIFDLYQNCSTLQSIINGSADYTFGEGVEFRNLPSTIDPDEENQDGDLLFEVIQKLIIDYWIFGGFAFQLIYNALGEPTEIIYLDFRYCRTDEKGNYVYYSDGWGNYAGKSKALKFKAFDPDDDKSNTQIYYFKGNYTRGTYPLPDWFASITSTETQIEIQKFHYTSIVNNFNVSAIINFNNGSDVDDDVKAKTIKSLNDSFTGSENASKMMVSWNDDKDHQTEVSRLESDDFDTRYNALANSTKEDIFISLRANPLLFGINQQTGFNTQEFQDAYVLYYKTSIKSKQNQIERIFDKVLGVKDSIKFIPFNIQFSNND